MKTRYLTISCLYPSTSTDNFMPLICISGRWLENAGFVTGNEVSVKVRKHGEMVINLIPESR